MHMTAAVGYSLPASDFAKIIGDPSDPGGRDHTCLRAETQDFVMLSSSVLVQSTIPALYQNTEHTPVTMPSSFSGRDRTLSSFKAVRRCHISFQTYSFWAKNSSYMVIWTPKFLCGASSERSSKGFPLRVILSVAIFSFCLLICSYNCGFICLHQPASSLQDGAHDMYLVTHSWDCVRAICFYCSVVCENTSTKGIKVTSCMPFGQG